MSLYFIRHGQSDANAKAYLAGSMDVALTDLGVQQAAAEARRLRDAGQSFDVIMSSPLVRAHQTAILIARELHYPIESIIIEPRLTERFCGIYEGGSLDVFFACTESEQIAGGAESLEHLGERVKEILQFAEVRYANKNVLLVSHAGFGEMLQAILRHNDYKKFLNGEKLPNATTVRLR